MNANSFFALALVMILIASFTTDAQPKPNVLQDEVRKLERAWLDAYEKKDVQAMNAIVADDFTITFADGEIQTKPQIIESLKRPGGTTRFTTENVQSRAYGDTVILTGLVISGPWMSDRSRYTDTYVKRNGKWQVVASHLSKATK